MEMTLTHESAIETDLVDGSAGCLVVFGGINNGIGLPPFEFKRITQELGVSRVFIRDVRQAWYHAGLNNSSKSIAGTIEVVDNVLRSLNTQNVVFAGNSMGGFAAMLFAAELGIKRVLTFSPQTFISPLLKFAHMDRRWLFPLSRLYMRSGLHQRTYDICNVLRDCATERMHIDVWYDESHQLDRQHAERLRGFNIVRLHPLQEGGHNVVKSLRNTGLLVGIIQSALAEVCVAHSYRATA